MPGGLKHITASTNYVWGMNSADNIYRCPNPCTGQWVQIDGALKQIDAGDHEVWGVNSNDDIFRRKVDGSGSWILVPGKLKHVSLLGTATFGESTPTMISNKCKKP